MKRLGAKAKRRARRQDVRDHPLHYLAAALAIFVFVFVVLEVFDEVAGPRSVNERSVAVAVVIAAAFVLAEQLMARSRRS